MYRLLKNGGNFLKIFYKILRLRTQYIKLMESLFFLLQSKLQKKKSVLFKTIAPINFIL